MKHFSHFLALPFLVGLSFFAPSFSRAQTLHKSAERIYFSPDATTKIVERRLTKRHFERFFVVKMRANQKMSVLVTPKSRATGIVPLIFVTSPSHRISTEKSNRFDLTKTERGDYLIRIAPNLMASNGDSGDFRLKIWAR